jgi:hypothetical protein
MDYAEPKTRSEKKGRDKSGDSVYNQKRVRQLEALMEKRAKDSQKKVKTN